MNVVVAQRLARTWSPVLSGITYRECAAELADEVDRLNAELERVRHDFEDQTYMLQQINEALADTLPEIAATIEQHPAARHLAIVTADTAAPCDT